MKFLKELGFQCFVFIVLLSLIFVGWDLSQPIINSDAQIKADDVVECIVYPFTNAADNTGKDFQDTAEPGFSFLFNIVLPITIYIICAGGFIYLLIENLRLLKACSYQSKIGKLLWFLWLGVLGMTILLPILFGAQLLMKGIILALIATAIFLLILSLISKLGGDHKKYRK
jgi:hypothetical protein